LRSGLAVAEGEAVTVGVRPEHLRPRDDGEWPIEVEVVEQLGGVSYIHGRLPSGERLVISEPGQSALKPGVSLRVGAAGEVMHLFRDEGDAAAGAPH